MSLMPEISIRKTISQDDPRELTTKVVFEVLRATAAPMDIFVCEYIPPTSLAEAGWYDYHHVVYLDELTGVKTEPENPLRACFVRRRVVIKYFINRQEADTWCEEMKIEVERFLRTLTEELQKRNDTLITVTEDSAKERPYEEEEEPDSSSSSEQLNDLVSITNEEPEEEEITLTFNGETL